MTIMSALLIGQKRQNKGTLPFNHLQNRKLADRELRFKPRADQRKGKRCVPFFRPSAERRADQFGELLCVHAATVDEVGAAGASAMTGPSARRARSCIWSSIRSAIRSLFMSRPPASAIAPRSAASPRTSKPPRLRTSNWPCVDQGDTGERPAQAAAGYGIRLEVVTLPEAKRGFILLARRWTPDRVRGRESFVWAQAFRRLIKDCERCVQTLADLRTESIVLVMQSCPMP
jgi:hypothetical protein